MIHDELTWTEWLWKQEKSQLRKLLKTGEKKLINVKRHQILRRKIITNKKYEGAQYGYRPPFFRKK